MPTTGFGVTLRTEVRNRLEQIAQERRQSLNRVIAEVLEAYVEGNPLSKLAEVKERALEAARNEVQAELVAARSLQETLASKIAALRSQKKGQEERISELRRQLLEDPNGFTERLNELAAELDGLERQRETLCALLHEAQLAFDDVKTELNEIEAKARRFFRQAYEGPALDLLDSVLNATAEELCRTFSLALLVVGTTRALRTVAERIRLMRYVENTIWARIAMNSSDPSVVSFATSKNLSDAFKDWNAVCRFIREDFAERDGIPVFEEA